MKDNAQAHAPGDDLTPDERERDEHRDSWLADQVPPHHGD